MKFGWITMLFCFPIVAGASSAGIEPWGKVPKNVQVRFSPESRGVVRVSGDRPTILAPNVAIRLTSPDEIENKPFDRDGGAVVYLEPNSGSGLRVVREEKWVRREAVFRKVPADIPEAVRRVYPYFKVESSRRFIYDDQGRIESVIMNDSGGRSQVQFCALYDAAGRVAVATSTDNNPVSFDHDFNCETLRGTPSLSMTEYFQYGNDGALKRKLSKSLVQPGQPQESGAGAEDRAVEDGSWRGYGELYYVNSSNGVGYDSLVFGMSDARGIEYFETTNFSVASSDVTPVFAHRSQEASHKLRYTFTGERVPPDLAKGLLEGVVGYARVRQYYHSTGQRVFEVFAPGAKYPRERQWRTLDLNRQENYDTSGKLTRVILSGPAPADGYTENLRAYAEKGVLKLTPLTNGYSSYRVYDYDATGRESLSFVCWRYEVSTNKPYAHFPWWESDPRPKRSREAELQYGRTQVGTRCGTPDGKMIVEGMGPVKKLMETKYGFGTTKLGLPGE